MKFVGVALAVALCAVLAVVGVVMAGVAGFFADEETSGLAAQVCDSAAAVTASTDQLPTVPGFSTEQLTNAGHILAAGADLDVPRRAQQVAVMTALGESSLRVLDHGDNVGPDSRGLFQQRANGAWGSYSDRMDPHTSATNFYRALLNVPGWQALEPTIAAHRTQRNANPWHYESYWPDATAIVDAFQAQTTGAVPAADQVSLPDQQAAPQAAEHLGRAPCAGELSTGAISPQGWANPASGHLTSPFGYRTHPITGQHHLHTGSDVANACGSTPVYAAADGVVIWQGAGGYQGRTGNQIVIDHDGTGGVITRYGHVLTGSILVRTGDHVTAGQQIASIGGDPTLDPQGAGGSTGCHLHFEVNLLGIPVDAREHLASHGVELGS